MDKLATFYSAFEIESRSADTIFRELCQPADYKKLNEGSWKEAFVNRYGEMMAAAPNMRRMTARLINEGLKAKGYAEVDAEHTYFVTFTDGYKNAGDTVYRHNTSQFKESYSLVDTAIFDIFRNDWWNPWAELANDRTNGIYSVGKEGPEWGPSNKLPFSSQVIANILYYDKIVSNSYPGEFDTFWNKYSNLYRDFLADSFLASALIQYRARLLTDEGFALLRNFYYGNYQQDCKVIKLDIFGYYASDIICIYLGTERMILYIPGANMPFREFVSMKEMKSWIAEQLRMPGSREALLRHFQIYDYFDGATFYGLITIFRLITEGNNDWNPQDKIIYKEQTYNLKDDVFGAMRNQVKKRTDSDKLQNPMSNPDYVMEFGYFFLSQVPMISMILPEAPVPFDIDASHTPLGLSSRLVLETNKLPEPHQNSGSRVDSDTFRALDTLRICNLMADHLKKLSRPADKIPAFASETQAITTRFGLNATQQEAQNPGNEPKLPIDGQPAHIRLVRLANDTQPLAVLSEHAGNQYNLLDTLTLEKVEGQLVSAVKDETTGKTYYTANGYFRGYLPYQPYRFAFEYLWTPAHFRDNLGELSGILPLVLSNVYDLLESIQTSVTLRQMQVAALELIQAVNAYTAGGTGDLPYKDTLGTVKMQAVNTFFLEGMGLLQESLLDELPVIGAQAMGYIYEAGIEEMAGENRELTATLLRYARYDDVIPFYGGGFNGKLTETLPYPPLYVVGSLDDFNRLSEKYFEQEPYKSSGLKDNKSVFLNALNETHLKGLLEPCLIYDNKLYIGCSYEEIVYTVSEASCNKNSDFTTHPLTVLRMLKELSGNAVDPGAGLISKYALPEYYRFIADCRLKTMCGVYHLTENFNFSSWDADYGESFGKEFEIKEGETSQQAVQRQIGMLLAGKGCALPANADGIKFFLDNLQVFTAAGVTCIGVTSLFGDLIQKEIDMYLTEGLMNHRLNAILLTLDEGQSDGQFRRLLTTARTENLSLLPLGQSDGSVAEESNGYTHLYFRGATLLNAFRQLPDTGKVVFFTHQYMMFSTPGINAPLPGLTQCLHIPGAWVDGDGQLHHYADSSGRSVLSEAEKWGEVDGEILPIIDNNPDPADVLLHLMPEDGKVLGLKVFSLSDIEIPTPTSREALLKKTVDEANWPALKQDVDAIKTAVSGLVTQEATMGATESVEINRQLEILGYQPGNGATLTWWIRGKDDKFYSPYFHTAPTVIIGNNEYVVDVAHLQFIYIQDEGVIILPVEEWAKEICARASALNPYLVYSMKTESELNHFSPFVFIAPRVPE